MKILFAVHVPTNDKEPSGAELPYARQSDAAGGISVIVAQPNEESGGAVVCIVDAQRNMELMYPCANPGQARELLLRLCETLLSPGDALAWRSTLVGPGPVPVTPHGGDIDPRVKGEWALAAAQAFAKAAQTAFGDFEGPLTRAR